jgi:hypothetical protein
MTSEFYFGIWCENIDRMYSLIHFCSWKLNSKFFNFLPSVWQWLNFMTLRTWKEFANCLCRLRSHMTVSCHCRLCSHMTVNSVSRATLAQTYNFITKWPDESHNTKHYYTFQHTISQNIQVFMIMISLLWLSPHTTVLLASRLARPYAWWVRHVRQTVVAASATILLPHYKAGLT